MPPTTDLATVRLLRLARDRMDRDYVSELTIAEVAAEIHLSPAHFTRTFRSVYGETPHQHLLTRRLERAASHLRAGMSVTDACTAVGFSSLGSFSSRFREVYGVSPSVYATQDHASMRTLPPFMAARLTRKQRHDGESATRSASSKNGEAEPKPRS